MLSSITSTAVTSAAHRRRRLALQALRPLPGGLAQPLTNVTANHLLIFAATHIGAAARETLIDLAADKWKVDRKSISVVDGKVKEWTTGNLAHQRGRLLRQEGRKSKFKKERSPSKLRAFQDSRRDTSQDEEL